MAFSMGGNGGLLSGRRRFRGQGTLSEINIVPLVDVVMVLLVIFMLTAHVMEFGLEVEVPKVKQVKDTTADFPVVSVSKDGDIYLNDKPTNINELAAGIKQKFPGAKGVYVRGDKDAIWDGIAQVFSALNAAKVPILAVTQPEDRRPASGGRHR
jgi:biopolymer transport protein ExbD